MIRRLEPMCCMNLSVSICFFGNEQGRKEKYLCMWNARKVHGTQTTHACMALVMWYLFCHLILTQVLADLLHAILFTQSNRPFYTHRETPFFLFILHLQHFVCVCVFLSQHNKCWHELGTHETLHSQNNKCRHTWQLCGDLCISISEDILIIIARMVLRNLYAWFC